MLNQESDTNILNNSEEQVTDRKNLISRFKSVRSFSILLCEPLEIEDYVIQSMPDVSPTKWHLAHTSWFFEAFVLHKANSNYKSIHPLYTYLFNSYYIQVGERWFRPNRGILSRPTVKQVFEYRTYVDEHLINFIESCNEEVFNEYLF